MSELYDIMNMSNSEMDKILESFVGKPRKEVEQELAVIRQQIQEVADTIPSKGNQGEQGPQGIAGKDGKQGKDGRDGLQGPRGFNGKDGKDGIEGEKGKDGVSVVNAYLDFDNSLTLELSDGNIIDAGQFNIPETMQNILQSLKQTGANSLLSLDDVNVAGATNSQVLTYDEATSTWIPTTVSGTGGGGSGTVTSVGLSAPTGLSVSGSPVTTNGTLALSYASGYSIPTDTKQATWDTALQDITSTDGSVIVVHTGTTADLSVAVAGATQNVICLVRNTTGATLTKGTAVYISGATGQNPTVSKALATSDATSAQTLGLLTADLANNSNGYVTVIGLITNINTSAYTDGEQLYLSSTTAGTLTSTKPYAPNHLVYVAVVEHAHPTQGKLFVKVQNGYEMDELHNVSAQTPSNGNTLIYNTSNQLWESTNITNVDLTTGTISTAPSSSIDLVNKSYADSIASGVNFHAAVNNATTTALPTNTYNNGTLGVSATLTAVANGALTIDGTLQTIGNRVLVKNEVITYTNGVYTVTQVGSGVLPYILTRATDYDSSGSGTNEIDAGDMLLVLNGTSNANTSWVQQTPLPITIGTTAIIFIEFAKVQTYTAGTGLSLATNQFSISDIGTAGTYGSSTLIPVITTNAQGQVTGVTTASNPQGTVTSVSALTLGTTGTDVSSTIATGTTTPVITLNVPTASAANRGALSSTDWSTFNGKQDTLVSTTNIKSINGASILGSGDLTVTGSFTGGTLTSQLKLAAGTASAGAAPLEFISGTLNTTAEAGAIEYDGNTYYSSIAASSRGVIPSEQLVVLTGTNTLTSQTGVQPIFDGGGGTTNGAITLPVGTYQYEMSFALTGMSATSGSFGFGLGGTATKTFSYHSTTSKAGTSLTTGQATLQAFGSAANTALQTASTGTVGTALIKGIMRVTVTGTVIPQVSLTVASAAVVQANSYFKVTPIGNVSTVATVGNWS